MIRLFAASAVLVAVMAASVGTARSDTPEWWNVPIRLHWSGYNRPPKPETPTGFLRRMVLAASSLTPNTRAKMMSCSASIPACKRAMRLAFTIAVKQKSEAGALGRRQ
jgi:hypothetical protein